MKSTFVPYFLVVFPAFFVGLWLFVSFILAQMGWNRLREFATPAAPLGQSFSMQSGTVGGTRYRGALTVVVAPGGLYLRPLLLFSTFHAPLLIPYQAFKSHRSQKMMWLDTTEFTVRTSQGQTVLIRLESKTLCEAVIAKVEETRVLQSNPSRSDAPLR